MIRITNEIVDIDLGGKMVKGILNGTLEAWSFQSNDPDFLALFPAGAVYSFSNYGLFVLRAQHTFQMEAEKKLRRLLVERCFMQTDDDNEQDL